MKDKKNISADFFKKSVGLPFSAENIPDVRDAVLQAHKKEGQGDYTGAAKLLSTIFIMHANSCKLFHEWEETLLNTMAAGYVEDAKALANKVKDKTDVGSCAFFAAKRMYQTAEYTGAILKVL